jgi:hypothetical protein
MDYVGIGVHKNQRQSCRFTEGGGDLHRGGDRAGKAPGPACITLYEERHGFDPGIRLTCYNGMPQSHGIRSESS